MLEDNESRSLGAHICEFLEDCRSGGRCVGARHCTPECMERGTYSYSVTVRFSALCNKFSVQMIMRRNAVHQILACVGWVSGAWIVRRIHV